ncbi:hypothetical protein DMB38_06265 [Streptomyces sp. WAC 06738]|uniref:hypothetical protein n=1 Tax=Streptomyces sp. WAC 06738 TaxID=2203210 RepID=UPI000F6CA017|nr:hypothetical protein [Streptomyces sp. WAC 06738]AZM45481.1 hypothetical protein DMB38_06265 [Streptomyces sp. WAC 06738]
MPDRTLEALGLATVPLLEPLAYPGPPVPGPSLLAGDRLLPLRPAPGGVGRWRVADGGTGTGLDEALAALGQPPVAARVPVLALGSNAAPGQVRHKLTHLGLPAVVPVSPVTAGGLGVGVSGHISAPGYVAAAPYAEAGAEAGLWVTWLDDGQLRAVDGTEMPNYGRALLPAAEFPVRLPGGGLLPDTYVYYNVRGILSDGRGRPLPQALDQPALLTRLLAASSRLRDLLGPAPRDWVARAGADAGVREAGTRIFHEEGWLLPERTFAAYDAGGGA